MYIKEMPSPSPFNIMPKAFSPLINKIQEAIFKIKTVAINKISFAPFWLQHPPQRLRKWLPSSTLSLKILVIKLTKKKIKPLPLVPAVPSFPDRTAGTFPEILYFFS